MAARRSLSSRSGFTIVEIAVILAIVGLMASVSLPSFQSMMNRNQVNQQIRQLRDDLSAARADAATGRNIGPSSPQVPLRTTVVTIVNSTTYQVMATDSTLGLSTPNSEITKIVTFSNNIKLRITNPTSGNIIFRSNGTLMPNTPNTITLQDQFSGQVFRLGISLTGSVKICSDNTSGAC